MWSLPEVDDVDAAHVVANRYIAANRVIESRDLPVIEHAFTHYKLRIQPLLFDGVAPRACVGDNDGLRWASREELAALGIPAPVRRLIEKETP